AARRLHYDFRLELDGVLKSWAVAKGPSLVPGDKRLAVHVEDHPLEYGDFEGVIPQGQYGAGSVIVWDRGHWIPKVDPRKGYAKGHLKFSLRGEKLGGDWNLVRMHPKARERGDNWLLIKATDDAARAENGGDILDEMPDSVGSGKPIETIADDPAARKWTRGKRAKLSGASFGALTPRQRAREPLASSGATASGQEVARKNAVKPLRIRFPKAARTARIGGFVGPCLAAATATPRAGTSFVHEVKFDGYRLQATLEKGHAVIRTRRGLDWTEKFPSLAKAIAGLPIETAVFDGEAVVEDLQGIADFAALQAALKAGRNETIAFYVFDLLYLNGHDVKPLPLLQRKEILEQVISAAPPGGPLRYSAHFASGGEELLQHVCRLGGEGIVSKHTGKPYRSGRNGDWLKSKCANRQEFVVVGYVPSTSTPKAIGSLVLGYHEKGKLLHAGRAGTGYNLQTARELFGALEKIKIDKPAAEGPLPADAKRDVQWVAPSLVADVEFRGWTAANILRQAAFKGLREDKAASEVVREAAAPDREPHVKQPRRANVRLTHPDRILWPRAGFTKQALADYYTSIWDLIAPNIVGRPLALLRCPAGVDHGCFFQRHHWQGAAPQILVINDPEEDEPLLGVANLDGLMELVQASALEIHPWGSKAKAFDKPDRLIFDLDPGDNTGWRELVAAALEVRARLADDKIESFVKTSGGKGLHVVAPVMPRAGWDEAKDYCRAVAEAMARDSPDRLTATMAKRARAGRIFVDYLRNGRGSTAVAAYSTRARPEAGIAMPLDWGELDAIGSADHFTLANASRRLNGLGSDPWQAIDKTKQRLPAKRSRTPRRSV
ncbi:MAG: DNA ligase D, partial [Pseudomonadota bacterium]|nr:DNA ligase D [Pseudomonadota bacterium]